MLKLVSSLVVLLEEVLKSEIQMWGYILHLIDLITTTSLKNVWNILKTGQIPDDVIIKTKALRRMIYLNGMAVNNHKAKYKFYRII